MHQRWYDQEASCPKLLRQIQGMPQPDVRQFCASVMVHFGEKLRRELQERDKKLWSVNSLGHSAISGLYRYGEQKRRWYDKDINVHKAVGILYTLNLEGLGIMGFKLGDTFGLLQIYSTVCHEISQKPDLREMASIATTALKTGTREAEEVLIALVGKDLYDSIAINRNHFGM